MCHGEANKEIKTKSLQFYIEGHQLNWEHLLMLMHLHAILLDIIVAHTFIHAHQCSIINSSHLRDIAIFDVMLAPSYNILSAPHSDGSMAKMISLNDDEEPTQKVFTKSQWST